MSGPSAAAKSVHWIWAIAINQFCYEQEKNVSKAFRALGGEIPSLYKQEKYTLCSHAGAS